MVVFSPTPALAETLEDTGFFFRYRGGIKFKSKDDGSSIEAAGSCRVIQTAPKFGLTLYSDLSGENQIHAWKPGPDYSALPAGMPCAAAYVARTADLLAKVSKDVGSDRSVTSPVMISLCPNGQRPKHDAR